MTGFDEKILRKKKNFFAPEVKVIELNGKRVLRKDYGTKLASFLVKHEGNILKQLGGIKGIPALVKVHDSILETEYIEGDVLAKFKPNQLSEDVYNRLCKVVNQMHKHGVVHLDLRQRKNIIIAKDGSPYLLDFANAIYAKNALRPIFEFLRAVDKSALIKLKNRYFPKLITDEDRKFLKSFAFWRRLWLFKPLKLRAKDKVW